MAALCLITPVLSASALDELMPRPKTVQATEGTWRYAPNAIQTVTASPELLAKGEDAY
jgi:type IV secretory pathway VirB9-like protein